MENVPKPRARKRIEDVRIPAVKGMPDDIYHLLHHSFVGIARMLRSIETANIAITSSEKAIAESRALLRRAKPTLETGGNAVSHVCLSYCGPYTAELRARLQRRVLEHVEKLAALEPGEPVN